MRRTVPLIALSIAAIAVLAIGCEPDGGKTAPVGNASALVGDEADEVIGPLDEEGDSEPDTVTGAWALDADSTATTSLALVVTNNSGAGLSAAVSVGADGVIGSASVPIGEVALGAGESVELSIDAASLPVRSTQAVSQFFATMSWTEETPGGPVERSSTTKHVFYRHEEGYGAVRTYSSESLKEELEGVIYSAPADSSEIADEAPAVGQVADGAGGFVDKRADDTVLAVKDADGNVLARIIGERISNGVPEWEVSYE